MKGIKCHICLDISNDPYKLACNHQYCKEGLKTHFTVIIKTKCDIRCPDCCMDLHATDAVKDLITDDLKALYDEFELQKKVDRDPNLHWGPKTNCTKYVELSAPPGKKCKAVCEGGMAFGVNGHQEWHPYSKGTVLTKENKKFYKLPEVKKCPQGQTIIQKSEGCLHMTCKVGLYEFGWNGGQKYSPRHFEGVSPGGFAEKDRMNLLVMIILIPLIMLVLPFFGVLELIKMFSKRFLKCCFNSGIYDFGGIWVYLILSLPLIPLSLAGIPFVIFFVIAMWVSSKIIRGRYNKFK